MLPHEAQEMMAKVLFGIFAISMVCMMRARAGEMPNTQNLNPTPIVKTLLK